jgi:hypothetical protein
MFADGIDCACEKAAAVAWRQPFFSGCGATRRYSCLSNVNSSIKSPIAGPLIGRYGSSSEAIGFARLSRLRLEMVGSDQLRSTNFNSDM